MHDGISRTAPAKTDKTRTYATTECANRLQTGMWARPMIDAGTGRHAKVHSENGIFLRDREQMTYNRSTTGSVSQILIVGTHSIPSSAIHAPPFYFYKTSSLEGLIVKVGASSGPALLHTYSLSPSPFSSSAPALHSLRFLSQAVVASRVRIHTCKSLTIPRPSLPCDAEKRLLPFVAMPCRCCFWACSSFAPFSPKKQMTFQSLKISHLKTPYSLADLFSIFLPKPCLNFMRRACDDVKRTRRRRDPRHRHRHCWWGRSSQGLPVPVVLVRGCCPGRTRQRPATVAASWAGGPGRRTFVAETCPPWTTGPTACCQRSPCRSRAWSACWTLPQRQAHKS